MPSSLGLSPELMALAATFMEEIAFGLSCLLGHGFSPVEQGPRLVATIESLLPRLSYSTDNDESSGSHHPS